MYGRWAERHGYKAEMVDELRNEEAGIRSATLYIVGDYAYGNLQGEAGVHRLVRISPFDSNARRQTSFAAVDVMPEIDGTIEIEIKPDDLRRDTFRSRRSRRPASEQDRKRRALHALADRHRRREPHASAASTRTTTTR